MGAAPQTSAPRFAAGWAALVYAIATLTLAYPALTGAFLVAPHSDQYIAGYAFREFAAASLRDGSGFPQWNPYLFGGMPYIAAMHGDIFYPTFLLRMMMPTDVAMTWGFVIHLFLAGFFTFGFLRAYGVGFYGSLIGGLAYMLSGPIAAYASPGHDGKLFVSALFPLTLWLLLRLVRDGRLWTFGALALVIGLAVLSPHPQLLQYLLLGSGAFALFIALSPNAAGNTLSRAAALKRLGLAFGAVVLGGIIGAIQYLPVQEYVDWSPRAGGKGYEHAISYSLPIEELLNAIVPEFSGILGNYWGINQIHFHSEYPGIVVLVLAGAGLFASGAASRRFRWFWIGTFVVSLLWALGGSTPFYRIIYAIVPGTKFFRAPSTMMFVTMFSIAVLAALGTERALTSATSISKKFFWGWGAAILAVGLIFASGLPVAIAESIWSPYAPQLTEMMVDRARANQSHVLVGALRSIVLVLLALGLIWATSRGKLAPSRAAWAFVALVAADLWIVERRYWIFSPPARVSFSADAAVDALRKANSPGRVITWDPTATAAYRDPAFRDALMVHRQRLVEGYHGNELGRYQQLIAAEASRFPFQGLRDTAPFSPEVLRHENVHYLYTTLPDSVAPQLQAPLRWSAPATKLVGPVKNAAGTDIYLYRLPGENPAAWVASVMVKGTDEQALATVLDPRFDATRAAIVDTAANVQVANLTTVPEPAGVQATVTRYDPGRINVRLDGTVPAGAALVVSENFYPGWRASVDGQDVVAVRANFNLIGVPLPAGAREVELSFTDLAYQTGKTVTLIALALALAALSAGMLMERRRLAPAI